ncbi:MAG TPA: uracil-DNA glycosylase [Candidatus Acidoferrales bacterium]|nr:uracil-DNA glycosylase [Candidatus Acidoferrales bacterium]
MDDSARARFEEWLKYADELGLAPFFRDRAAVPRNISIAAEAVQSAAPSMHESARASAATEIAKTRTQFQSSRPSAAARSTSGPALPIVSAAPPVNLPVAAAPSLFDAADKIEGDTLERVREDIGDCKRCRLHLRRHTIVFGSGNPKAKLVFVGEGPGADEDAQGLPFVGRAGKLLTQMIEAMGLRREDVYICNVVKCRPPENRTPERDEIATCSPFLTRQIDVIKPQVIVCLGSVAAQTLLATNQPISRFRGEWLEYRGARLLATYHPAYLLRNPPAKAEVWKDLQKVMAVLGLQQKKMVPPR